MRQNRNRVSNSTRQKAVVKETFQRHKAKKKNTEPTATMVGKAKENFFIKQLDLMNTKTKEETTKA